MIETTTEARVGALVEVDGTLPDTAGFILPFRVRHNLADHPLLTDNAIDDLGATLPAHSVEMSPINAPVVTSIDFEPTIGAVDIQATLASLSEQHRSLFLLNLEQFDPYRQLLDETLSSITTAMHLQSHDIAASEGYLFIAGEGAVTSVHVDHECNFLLVLRGSKRLWLADVGDPQGELALEALHSGRYGTCADRPKSMTAYDLEAGEGVFIPPRAAHFVEHPTSDCMALSVVFVHDAVRRQVPVYAWNARLRSLGLTPTPPDTSPMRDLVKRASHTVATKLRRQLRSAADV